MTVPLMVSPAESASSDRAVNGTVNTNTNKYQNKYKATEQWDCQDHQNTTTDGAVNGTASGTVNGTVKTNTNKSVNMSRWQYLSSDSA